MKAIPVLRRRVVVAIDAFVEMAVWRVPEPVEPSAHLFKYRLAYVVGGVCVLRYDNERGKGDHRHFSGIESTYEFRGPDRLISDFEFDIERWNREHRRT
ncbi:MAG: hypothetical protein GC151_18595 [Betaproteobacteria bacterium]|nr:hypothetical protein [Betaproteobacteria bacterium]